MPIRHLGRLDALGTEIPAVGSELAPGQTRVTSAQQVMAIGQIISAPPAGRS
jgi:hypothetical protein